MRPNASPKGPQYRGLPAAVILDMDGVIVDSEHQWKLAEGPFFGTLVPQWSEKDHERIVGLGVVDLYHWLVKEHRIRETKESFLSRCDALAREIYGKKVTRTEGVPEFLSELRGRKVAAGLASSSPRAWIDIVLERFGLEKEFAVVVSGDEVEGRNKPEPEIYLLAAQRLGAAPSACAAVEDSNLGVRAAKKAGMYCVAFRNGHNSGQDLSPADAEFSSFADIATHLAARLNAAE